MFVFNVPPTAKVIWRFKDRCFVVVVVVVVVVVDSLFSVAPIVCRGSMFGSCFAILYLVSFIVLQ